MRRWFETEIDRRRASGELGADMMGALLPHQDDSTTTWSDAPLAACWSAASTRPRSTVAKIIAVLAADKRSETRVPHDVDDPARLDGWCWEVLRRWPHNPIVIREAAADTVFNTVGRPQG